MLRFLLVGLLVLPVFATDVLPVGSAPAALGVEHFPSRVHCFVWRNWNLVESSRIARVLGASVEDVRGVAASMGLPAERGVPEAYGKRLYLSVIKRNWHLLPYEQLLVLLGWTPERLAHTLREDDFFFIKLGSLKPRCEPLVWAAPTQGMKARAAEIKALVGRAFADWGGEGGERPLGFLEGLTGEIADGDVRPVKSDQLRFLYSYFAVFGDPLSDPSLDPYPDALLQRYADLGVNGVWLHVVLRDLAPSKAFGEFGKGHAERLKNLAALVKRAKRFGIGVYLYMNEPRAMPKGFFDVEGRREMAGVAEGDFVTMCTSNGVVRQWLEDSLAHVFGAVPDLAGVFTITASENLTSCASHHKQVGCARCKDRKPAEVIAEVNRTIERGVHRAAPGAKVIAWDWGWRDEIAADVIAGLPASAWLMSVSEWSLPIERGGVKTAVGEYSISSVGPGPRAKRHWELARARGLKTVAKIAASNTWELSAVPYVPAYELVGRHASNLAAMGSGAGVDGLMMSWSLGGYPSPNLEVFGRLAGGEGMEGVLDGVARRTFGEAGAPHARRAWGMFSRAFAEYPYHGSVVYNGPQQVGPANLLYARPTGYRSTMVGFAYDDLEHWRGVYPAGVFAGQFEKVAKGWEEGVAELERAVAAAPEGLRAGARRELGVARAAGVHLASVANQARFVMARDGLAKGGDREKLVAEIRRLIDAEAGNAKALWGLQRADSRVGFEASNHYYYLAQDLVEKVVHCAFLKEGVFR